MLVNIVNRAQDHSLMCFDKLQHHNDVPQYFIFQIFALSQQKTNKKRKRILEKIEPITNRQTA